VGIVVALPLPTKTIRRFGNGIVNQSEGLKERGWGGGGRTKGIGGGDGFLEKL